MVYDHSIVYYSIVSVVYFIIYLLYSILFYSILFYSIIFVHDYRPRRRPEAPGPRAADGGRYSTPYGQFTILVVV